MAVILGGLTCASAWAAERQYLHDHVPASVAKLRPSGRLAPSKRLKLAMGLPLRNQAELTDLLQQLADPASPNYRRYLTPAQCTERFGPSAADYQAVTNFLNAHGFTITATHPNRVVLDFEGAVADVEAAFQITMRTYKHPKEARDFYAPGAEPSLGITVPVLHISGLDNYSIPHPNSRIRPAGAKANVSMIAPNSGSAPGGGYAPADLRAAYVPGVTLNGSGQSVGLLQFDGYYASDIASYRTQFGLPNIPLVNVAVDGGVTTPGTGNSEVCLDIEMVMSMAPGVSAIYVYMAPNPSPWADLISRMANDNLSKQLSCSWGGGSPDATCETLFQQMAAQGQSFFNATGDSDAFTASIPFPSDSPHITEVGATTLTTTGGGGSYVSETVWNWGNGTGSSGGSSTYYSIPSWQQGVSMAGNQGSATKRNVPDVALVGDNIYVLYNNGGSGNFGGTSCAAPLWAAFIALVNQQSVANGHSTVGFLNPTLYATGTGASYASTFHDITTGNNFSTTSPSQYSGVTGFDLCTGWGTPNGSALINLLAGNPDALVLSSTFFNPSGFTGGPFTPSTCSYVLQNTGSASLTWTASTTQSWLLFSATTGVLEAGGSTTVTASLNANGLAAGTYSSTVTFNDVPTGGKQTTTVGLTVLSRTGVLSVTPATAFVSTGIAGSGTFAPASGTYSISNTGGASMNWSVSNTSNWMTVSPTSGTLVAGGSTKVTASIVNSVANALSSGTYTGSLGFVNLTSGSGNTSIACQLNASVDYFTQMFSSGANNTANHSFTFTPNGSTGYYVAHCDGTTGFPTNPTAGTKLTLTDDSYSAVTLSGSMRASLYGTAYSTFYVGSNGYITFNSGDTTYSTSLSNHFAKPRISAFYRDLNPASSGTISWLQLSDRAAVTYQNVPAYGTTNQNSFQVELFFDGRIRITILSIASTDGLIGLSRGTGQPSGYTASTFIGYSPSPRSDASLTGLSLSSGTLNPVFSSSGTSYTAGVGSAVSTISVTPTLSDTAATVQLRVNGGAFSPGTSGAASAPLALATGANPVDVKVVAQDGTTTKVYTATITRATSYTISVTGNAACGTLTGGGAYDSGVTATVTATPQTGYRFVYWTENGTAVSNSSSYTFTVAGNRSLTAIFQALTFGNWAASQFTAAELANPAISGDAAEPNRDGIPNLLKYALNSGRTVSDRSVLPRVTVEGGYLTLTYAQNSAATDLTFIVEVSPDLINWSSGAAYTTSPAVVGSDAQTQTVKVSDLTPASPGNERFIRLRVIGL